MLTHYPIEFWLLTFAGVGIVFRVNKTLRLWEKLLVAVISIAMAFSLAPNLVEFSRAFLLRFFDFNYALGVNTAGFLIALIGVPVGDFLYMMATNHEERKKVFHSLIAFVLRRPRP